MKRIRLICIAALALTTMALPSTVEAKIKSSFSNGILTVKSGKKADRVKVTCGGDGLTKVNGRDPKGGALSCSVVSEVDAVMGGGNDRVNFFGVDGRFGKRDLPGFGTGTGAAAVMGPGDDTYIGSGSAFNLFFGGSGNDSGKGGPVRDSMSGGVGNDTIRALGGRDLLVGQAGADTLAGGADDDLVSGNSGDDGLSGGAGADLIGGGLGMDRLRGGDGDDRLIGGPQKDRLDGGAGNNELIQDAPKK
jgi:Ca2+-binding RTX toxin-like protein